MSEKKRILEAVRMRMRRDGMTYAQLAQKLKVSEVSVKRYFSEQRLSLDMLDEICRVLSASLEELLGDLKTMAGEQQDTFTTEQEAALANDEFLFNLFFMIARGYSFDDIDNRLLGQQTARIIIGLRDLERLHLIAYPSNKEVRSLVSCNAHIRPGGPMWEKYSAVSIQEFFDYKFSSENSYFKLSLGYMSEDNARQLKKKFALLEDEIKTMLAIEQVMTKNSKSRKFYWIASAFRPMESTVLEVIAERSNLDTVKSE